MHTEKYVVRFLAIILIVGYIIALHFVSGCSAWNYDRKEFDPQGRTTCHVKAKASEFLQTSEIDKVRITIDGQKRELTIGSVYKDPDPEAIRAAFRGISEGVIATMNPIL